MDYDVPMIISKTLNRYKSADGYEIYSDYALSDSELSIASENIECLLKFAREKLRLKLNVPIKIIIFEKKSCICSKYFCSLEKGEIKDFDLGFLNKVLNALVNISPRVSDDAWLVYGLVNYFLYLYIEEKKGQAAGLKIIEDWRTFIFSMQNPEPILNNIQGKYTDILLEKKAPYIFKMLETVFGRAEFLEQLSDFLNKDSFNSIHGESFIEFVSLNFKPDLENFIHQCLTEREIPSIRINKHLTTDEKGRHKFYGEIIQETNKPYEVPVIFDFELERGGKERRIHHLKKNKERYEFVFSSKPVSFNYNSDSSILVKIRT